MLLILMLLSLSYFFAAAVIMSSRHITITAYCRLRAAIMLGLSAIFYIIVAISVIITLFVCFFMPCQHTVTPLRFMSPAAHANIICSPPLRRS
jgi:hypothetical protein